MKNSNNAQAVYGTLGSLGSVFISDTSEHVGPFENIQALTDCVADLSKGILSPPSNSTSVTIKAGTIVRGKWSAITLASGSAQAFNATMQDYVRDAIASVVRAFSSGFSNGFS